MTHIIIVKDNQLEREKPNRLTTITISRENHSILTKLGQPQIRLMMYLLDCWKIILY